MIIRTKNRAEDRYLPQHTKGVKDIEDMIHRSPGKYILKSSANFLITEMSFTTGV